MMRLLTIIVAAFAAAALGSDGATTVTLRHRVDPAAAAGGYTVQEVATVEGPLAETIGRLPVAPTGDRVDATSVRTALKEAGVNMGLVVIGGQPCRIDAAPVAPRAATGPRPARDAQPEEIAWAEGDTVRTRIIARLAAAFDVSVDDLQIGFDAADAPLLNTPAADRTVVIKPLANSDRIPLNVQIFLGDQLVSNQTIRAAVKVRRDCLVASRPLNRDDQIDSTTGQSQRIWLEPSVRPADPERSMGMVVRSRVDAGRVIEERDIEAPVIVRKGDLVTIECLSGTIRLKTIARAMGSARDGEICAFRVNGSDQTFHARMNGRGRAVTVTTAHPMSSKETLAAEASR